MGDPQRPWRQLHELGLHHGHRALFETWRALDLRRLWRVLLHSVLVGALAGAVACVFFTALEWVQHLLLGGIARVHLPTPGGEIALVPTLSFEAGPIRPWAVVGIPTLGGLLCGLIVYKLVPEAAGPGGDAYIEAFHHRGGAIRKRVPPLKALASLLTLGTGGAAGREGPTMQVSAGLGSLLAQGLKLGTRERRVLMIAGAAAGMGAIFRTPLGAALYAVEVLYRDDFETEAIVPAVLASVTAYSIFTTVFGVGHLFTTAEHYPFIAASLPFYVLMAMGLSLFGVLFVRIRHGADDKGFRRLPIPQWAKPAAGGLCLGVLGLFVPEALGAGYGVVQGALDMDAWLPVSWAGVWLLLGLATAKMFATAFTIGSGGSGGEFGPSLVVGGLTGGGFGLLFHLVAPDLVPDPAPFALVGMGAFFGGVAHVPVSSLIIVCEMTGTYDLLVPLMLTEAITFVLLRRVAIYREQLPSRLDSPAHRADLTVDVLESIPVEQVYAKGKQLNEVESGAPIRRVLQILAKSEHAAVLVRDVSGELRGMVSLEFVRATMFDDACEGLLVAADVMAPLAALGPDDDLHTALDHFLATGSPVLPVVRRREHDGTLEVLGLLTQQHVTRAYDGAVTASLVAAAGA